MDGDGFRNGEHAAGVEAARLAAVRRYGILDTSPDGAFDRVARLAARLFATPIATVTIVDEQRIWFKARHGLDDVTEIPRDPGLCASAILHDEPYLVTDARVDPRTLHHPLVRGELGLRFYAAAPIVTVDGYRLGTVNVIDRTPRQVRRDDLTMLQDLAAIVADELELRLAAI
ncbi:MAG TPA: GAF domain-containing protein [Actinomycetes bacterium]